VRRLLRLERDHNPVAVHHFYDETSGHPVIVAAAADRRPFWRAALFGVYMELVSVQGKRAVSAARKGKPVKHVDRVVTVGDITAIEPMATDCVIAGLIHYDYMRCIGADVFQLTQHDKLSNSWTAMKLWWEAEKRKDTSDEAMKAAIRWRDGDQCRVCHCLMTWARGNDTNPLGGTFDHRIPGEPAQTTDDLAAVCRRCNGIRSDAANANEFAPWQPVPAKPFYSPKTAELLKKTYPTDPTGAPMRWTGKEHFLKPITILPRPTVQVDPAFSDLEAIEAPLPPKWTWTVHEGNNCRICGPRPHNQWDTASTEPQGASSAHRSPVSDPESLGAPLMQEPPENLAKTSAKPLGFSPPDPSPPRTKHALPGGGRGGGDGLDGFVGGAGRAGVRGRRPRGRRSRSAPAALPAKPSHAAQSEEKS